jgi:hypothetical protein
MRTVTPHERATGTALVSFLGPALASLAAAAIHFAVVSDHLRLDPVHGLFFLVVAWAQALWAVAILVTWRRWLLLAGIAGNLAIVVVWILSRTMGLPVPPEPWTPEAAGAPDVAATVLEVAVVAWCWALLRRPATGHADRPAAWSVFIGIALPLAVVSGTSIGLGEGHVHGESSGHHAHGDGHVSMVAPGDLNADQIELVRDAMSRYRDVEVAFADGWETEHEDWPEIGSHFYRGGDWLGAYPARPGIDLLDPEFLMYSKFLTGQWELIAVAYVADVAVYETAPAEISGAEYHQHVWTCVVDGEELEEDDYGPISEQECEQRGGVWDPGGVWMTHIWLIDNPNGIFAESNPELKPRDG